MVDRFEAVLNAELTVRWFAIVIITLVAGGWALYDNHTARPHSGVISESGIITLVNSNIKVIEGNTRAIEKLDKSLIHIDNTVDRMDVNMARLEELYRGSRERYSGN